MARMLCVRALTENQSVSCGHVMPRKSRRKWFAVYTACACNLQMAHVCTYKTTVKRCTDAFATRLANANLDLWSLLETDSHRCLISPSSTSNARLVYVSYFGMRAIWGQSCSHGKQCAPHIQSCCMAIGFGGALNAVNVFGTNLLYRPWGERIPLIRISFGSISIDWEYLNESLSDANASAMTLQNGGIPKCEQDNDFWCDGTQSLENMFAVSIMKCCTPEKCRYVDNRHNDTATQSNINAHIR